MDHQTVAARFETSVLTPEEISRLGFGAVGQNCRLSRFARYYDPANIFIGSDVRVDDFAILSPGSDGEIRLAGFNHIGSSAALYGSVSIGEWSTISGRTAVYAKSDDFNVNAATYPHAGTEFRAVVEAPIQIGSRVVVGTGCTLLPGAIIDDGVAVGAMSLVDRHLDRPGLYVGVPARFVRTRRDLTSRGEA